MQLPKFYKAAIMVVSFLAFSVFSGEIGYHTVYENTSSNTNRNAVPVIMPENGDIVSISVYHGDVASGQMQGGITQGIGWALSENYIYRNGVMQNASLMDYLMPTVADVPAIETLLVEVRSATGPFGIRGVGEPPIIPTLATVANAIHSAAGIRLKALPMTPEALLRALRDSGAADKKDKGRE